MIYQEIEREFFFPSWMVQLFVVHCGPMLCLGLLENALGLSDSYATEVLDYFLFAIAGFGLARLVASTWRDAPIEGSLVWIIPAGLMGMGFVWEWVWSGFASVLRGFFWVAPGHGEEGLGIVLITLPTLCCCCYSLVMNRRLRINRAKVVAPAIQTEGR